MINIVNIAVDTEVDACYLVWYVIDACYLVWYARHNHQRVLGLVISGSSLRSCLNIYSSGDGLLLFIVFRM